MGIPLLHRDEVREIDRRAIQHYAIPGIVLMENAGRGCVDTLCRIGVAGPVAICCGKGNNAGDGLVIARHLELRGIPARVLFWSNPDHLQGDAAVNYKMVRTAGLPVSVLDGASDGPNQRETLAALLDGTDWIVDALLGTGAQGDPRAPLDQVIDRLNLHESKKMAVDIPSGLDCESGQPSPHTFRANHTCTFVAAKPGLVAMAARPLVGELHILDIGVPTKLLKEFGL